MNHAEVLSIRPLDCIRILADLKHKGISSAEVARILGLDASTVRWWKRGQLPGDPHGRRLIALYLLYFPGAEIPAKRDINHPRDITSHI